MEGGAGAKIRSRIKKHKREEQGQDNMEGGAGENGRRSRSKRKKEQDQGKDHKRKEQDQEDMEGGAERDLLISRVNERYFKVS